MPIPVKLPKRQIEYNMGNQEILDAYEKCQSSIILNETEIDKIDTNQILKNIVHTGIKDSIFGKHGVVIINEITLSLDIKAYELYQNFSFFLNNVAKSMGFTLEIDADLLNDKKAVKESFGLIRILLHRLCLKILATQQMPHFQAWDTFITSITNMHSLTNMHTSGVMGVDLASVFQLIFLVELKPWQKKIEEWAIVKKIRLNMEIYFQDLVHIEKDVFRCLYLRLLIALDKKIVSDAFNSEWIKNSLYEFETKTLNVKDNQVISMKKIDKIYNTLKSQKKKQKYLDAHVSNTEFVKKLYLALYNLFFAKNLIMKMDEITNYHECLPCLMAYINIPNLERFIENCIDQSNKACTLDGLEKSIMTTVWTNNVEIKQSTYISHIPVKKMYDAIILEDDFLSKLILGLVNDFMKLCVSHELGHCDFIITQNSSSPRSTRSNSNSDVEQVKSNKIHIKGSEQLLFKPDNISKKTEIVTNIKKFSSSSGKLL